jgi:hypothetical protein
VNPSRLKTGAQVIIIKSRLHGHEPAKVVDTLLSSSGLSGMADNKTTDEGGFILISVYD